MIISQQSQCGTSLGKNIHELRIITLFTFFDKLKHATWFQGNYQDYCNHIGTTPDPGEEKYKHKKLV